MQLLWTQNYWPGECCWSVYKVPSKTVGVMQDLQAQCAPTPFEMNGSGCKWTGVQRTWLTLVWALPYTVTQLAAFYCMPQKQVYTGWKRRRVHVVLTKVQEGRQKTETGIVKVAAHADTLVLDCGISPKQYHYLESITLTCRAYKGEGLECTPRMLPTRTMTGSGEPRFLWTN